MPRRLAAALGGLTVGLLLLPLSAAEPEERPRLLLLAQGPDGHPPLTHEYRAGLQIVAHLLREAPVDAQIVLADDPWEEGPGLLAEADGVFVFLAEGARWMQAEPRRHEAFVRLAERGGGFVAWHWGMGTREAGPIAGFLRLLGGCHGGPDRKYAVVDAELRPAGEHPVLMGLGGLRLHEEFYYRLKFAPGDRPVTPLLTVELDGADETVGWAWERPDGGRSVGFSGGHFHENWRLPEYRRLAAQAALWTLGQEIPAEGWPTETPDELLKVELP